MKRNQTKMKRNANTNRTESISRRQGHTAKHSHTHTAWPFIQSEHKGNCLNNSWVIWSWFWHVIQIWFKIIMSRAWIWRTLQETEYISAKQKSIHPLMQNNLSTGEKQNNKKKRYGHTKNTATPIRTNDVMCTRTYLNTTTTNMNFKQTKKLSPKCDKCY